MTTNSDVVEAKMAIISNLISRSVIQLNAIIDPRLQEEEWKNGGTALRFDV